MKRRLFLQFPLVAAAVTLQAETKFKQEPGKGFKVEAGKDRFNEALLFMGGRFDLKVSAKDTNGALCIYDTTRYQKGGPGLHYHNNQDEWFYIIKGEFKFQIGEETFYLKPGDTAFGPRKIPHAFAMTSEGEGQMMVMWQPAGTMEDFFKAGSKINKNVTSNFEKEFKELSRQHDMEVVGPPLKFD